MNFRTRIPNVATLAGVWIPPSGRDKEQKSLGVTLVADGCEFRVWPPSAQRIRLRLLGRNRDLPMDREADGYFAQHAAANSGDKYFYIVDDNKPVPDPVSRLLPEGVHGPTEIVDPNRFSWTDEAWRGLPLKDYVIYELHIGTFTPQGTLDAAIEKLPYLKRLGVTAVELTPVAAFPGTRNWGYDGVSPYAVQASYGGPGGFPRLGGGSDALGLAVVLHAGYIHLGSVGYYLRTFSRCFSDRH